MRRSRLSRTLAIAVLAALCTAGTDAANVLHLTLREIVERADRIVRGTVIAADEDTVAAGGGNLPIVVYRIRVDDTVKGSAAAGDVIEVRLLATPKISAQGSVRRAALLRDLPQFTVGEDYLFALTRPSAAGLSTTVGLGQGLFELRGRQGEEVAVNGANNMGLFADPAARQAPGVQALQRSTRAAGPISYGTLVGEMRSLLGR